MASPTHLSSTVNATSHTYSSLQEGDLLVALIFQTSAAVRTYNVTHNAGAVTWNKATQMVQNNYIVAICWTIVTAADLVSGVTTAVTSGGSAVHNVVWCHARPATGTSVSFGGTAGFNANTAGTTHSDVSGGFDIPADSITYSVGVLTATATVLTKNADFTLISTDNSRYLTQYRENSTALDGSRATWTNNNSRLGPSAMLTILTTRTTTKQNIRDTLYAGHLGEVHTGTTYEDTTRFNRDASIVGGTWAESTGLTTSRWGIQYAGSTSSYAQLTSMTTGLETMTFGAWVRRTAAGAASQTIFHQGNGGANGIGLAIDNTGLLKLIVGGVAVVNTSATLALDTNYHVVLARIGGATNGVWVNGTLVLADATVPNTPDANALIGYNFSGWMADPIYLRRNINQTEINWLADSSNSLIESAAAFKAAWARQANVLIGGTIA